MKEHLPAWTHEWLQYGVPALQILLTLLVAWLLRLIARRLLRRVGEHYTLPPEMIMGARRVFTFVVYFAVLLVVLQIIGVQASVLWTAFTGFAAVGAVAFFAAWSVLSNIFCALLILTTRPFRLGDRIELLENGDKPGLGGRVVDINFVHTTLHEAREDGTDTVLQIPNSQFFQKVTRLWR